MRTLTEKVKGRSVSVLFAAKYCFRLFCLFIFLFSVRGQSLPPYGVCMYVCMCVCVCVCVCLFVLLLLLLLLLLFVYF